MLDELGLTVQKQKLYNAVVNCHDKQLILIHTSTDVCHFAFVETMLLAADHSFDCEQLRVAVVEVGSLETNVFWLTVNGQMRGSEMSYEQSKNIYPSIIYFFCRGEASDVFFRETKIKEQTLHILTEWTDTHARHEAERALMHLLPRDLVAIVSSCLFIVW